MEHINVIEHNIVAVWIYLGIPSKQMVVESFQKYFLPIDNGIMTWSSE